MFLLTVLWSRVAPYVLAAGAVLVAIATFGATQRRAGRDEVRAANTRRTLEQAEIRHDVEDAVRRSGDGTAADELRRDWGRDERM